MNRMKMAELYLKNTKRLVIKKLNFYTSIAGYNPESLSKLIDKVRKNNFENSLCYRQFHL